MHAAGLLDISHSTRRGFMRWGGGGRGQLGRGSTPTTSHVFAVIAGLRWDTSMTDDGDRSGPGWSEYMRLEHSGFRLRHPLGLMQDRPEAPTAG